MPTKEQLAAAHKAAKNVDWSRVDRMTDAEIEAVVAADPDEMLATPQELDNAVATARARRTAAE